MKKIIAFCSFIILLNSCVSAQKKENEINQKLDNTTIEEIVLVKVISDSRCPEGTQCIWAGEVAFEVAAYKNKQVIEQVQFTLNQNTKEAIKSWFIKYLPEDKKDLKEIDILPHPIEGVPITGSDYRVKLFY